MKSLRSLDTHRRTAEMPEHCAGSDNCSEVTFHLSNAMPAALQASNSFN